MKIHLLSGFLGSGKTTAIRTAVGLLMQAGVKTGVITNDQGIRLVDGGFMAAAGIPERQVKNGCFCCNYGELDRQIGSLIATDAPEVIFAESVGSCTDIVATVLKPLLTYRPEARTTLSVFCDGLLLKMLLLENRRIFRPEVEYIYWKQIEEASLILVNKTDLLAAGEITRLLNALDERFGGKTIRPFLAGDPDPVAGWLAMLDQADLVPTLSPQVDYDIYAAGEAMMGWLDMEIEVQTEQPVAGEIAEVLVTRINDRIRGTGYPVGHIKWLIDDREKISVTTAGAESIFPALPEKKLVRLLLNARVQALPEKVMELVKDTMEFVSTEKGASIRETSLSAFQPGYPRPEHRFV